MLPIAARIEEYIKYLKDIAKKWSSEWLKHRVYEADPVKGVEKYFTTAAFMYPNAPAHIGHARTYLIPDIISRFKRSLDVNVLFPMAFHYTGTPILVMAERIASNDEEFIKKLEANFGIPAEELKKLREPLVLARYFHEISKDAMNYYGLSIDWRREFTTIDPEFKAFIRWQFKKLKDKGFVTKGSHPVGWCPRHSMPVGMHDTKDDVEPEIEEFTIIKFKDSSGRVFPAATLRPETVLGVTNMWVNPDEDYCECLVKTEKTRDHEVWILACKAAERLKYQMSIKVLRSFKGRSLINEEVVNPLTGKKVKVLPGRFVSPKYGTGVVMSVPAHAPYDYAALMDYVGTIDCEKWGDLRPIPLIRVEGYSEFPARDVIVKLKVKSQEDRALLDRATKEVYREELERGIMRSDLSDLVEAEIISGAREFIDKNIINTPVREARELIKEFLMKNGYGDVLYELINAPVYCRCGAEVVVKLLENQWFLNYGDPKWKSLAKELLSSMRIVPEEARKQFLATIDWLRERACARSRGLGTELPWEKGWIIESLSDSTIYMAFYTVIHKIRKYGISASKLTEEFWDYVMLGIGSAEEVSKKTGIPVDVLNDIRSEFLYWYPLDSRHSGKDLIPNHLTFFIFNHAAIFPKELWPRQIVANGWVLISGEKMSKSKGNVRTLMGLIDAYSPDAVRLALATIAEVEQDLNFDEESVLNAARRLSDLEELILELSSKEKVEKYDLAERWLMSRLYSNVSRVIKDLEDVKVRSAGIRIFYIMYSDIKKYVSLTDKLSKCLDEYIRIWLKLISWYTPFIAEEIWHKLGNKSFIVKEKIPALNELRKYFDPEAEVSVMYVSSVVEDIKNITRIVKGERALIYVANKRDYAILKKVISLVDDGRKLSEVIREIKDDVIKLGYKPKELPLIARQLYEVAVKMEPEIRKYVMESEGIDEKALIEIFKDYIKEQTGIEVTCVYVRGQEIPAELSKKGKVIALPWRPSILIY